MITTLSDRIRLAARRLKSRSSHGHTVRAQATTLAVAMGGPGLAVTAQAPGQRSAPDMLNPQPGSMRFPMPTAAVRPGVNPLALAQHLVHSLTGRQHPIILAGFDRLVADICDDGDDSGYDHIVVSAVLAIACAAHGLAFIYDEPAEVAVALVTDHFRGTLSLEREYVLAVAEYARTREPRHRELIDCAPAALQAVAAAAAAWLCVVWADDDWNSPWYEDEIDCIERLWCDVDLLSHL